MEILFRSIDDLQHVMTIDLRATSLIQRGITYLGRQLAIPFVHDSHRKVKTVINKSLSFKSRDGTL